MKTITRAEIEKVLPGLELIPAIEQGFVAYSSGQCVVPPVGEMLLDKGEVHIKYGCLIGEDYYVIKIASGFYENPRIGLPSGDGLMLLFSQDTGQLKGILLDEGQLTDARTAVAGAIAAKHLAPKKVECIGIVGTGVQARLQLAHLEGVSACRDVLVWGRGDEQLEKYKRDMEQQGYSVKTTKEANDVLRDCNLIVTTTPALRPILLERGLKEGTHITAMGSDTSHKQELDPKILHRADVVVADSIPQCLKRGEIHQALRSGYITQNRVKELGDIIAGRVEGRTSDHQITVVDLTGVAVQDIKIATAVYEACEKK